MDVMDNLGAFDSTVVKKFETMRSKNEYLLQNFPDFPISETVIQNYRCAMKQGEQSFGGKLWLTQNYLLFTSSTVSKRSQISYMEIKEAAAQEGFVGYTSEMLFDLDSGYTISFCHFYHFAEAYTLIRYLMDHSPCYYHIPTEPPKQKKSKSSAAPVGNGKQTNVDGRWEELASSFKSCAPIEAYVKPDVKLAEDCLELAEEIFANGVEIRAAVEEDARTLDRVERNIEETEYHVKKGGREISAMGSMSGQVKKMVIGGLVDKKLGVYDAPDRDAGSQEAEQFYDIPILIKHPNCDLEPAILRFGQKEFLCVTYPKGNSGKLQQIRDYKYSYHNILSCVLRVRPLHIDVRFNNEKESHRLRCVSSHVQMIANEVELRTNGRAKIIFEPGTRKFEYGDEWLRRHPLQSNRSQRDTSVNLFDRQSMRMTDVVVHAPKEIIVAVDKTDEIVDQLQKTVNNIKVNTNDIKAETDRQTDQASDIHKSLDKTMQNMHKQSYEVRKLI